MTSPALPTWLLAPTNPVAAPQRRRHRFLHKSLAQVDQLLATLSEPPARLAQVDPRVKLITALTTLVILAFLHDPRLISLAAVSAAVGAIAVGAGRSLLALAGPVLLMSALVLAPATLSAVRPGTVVVPLGVWAGTSVGLTDAGLTNAWTVLARLLASLAIVVVLTRTTSWLRLTAALRSIGAPAGFVLIATMAHRYLWLLARGLADLLLARRARSIGGATGGEDRAFVGGTVGALMGRSSELSEQVYQAMVARGFTGHLIDPTPQRLRWLDAAGGAVIVALSLALLWGDVIVR